MIFSPAMIKAIKSGRKTETRRVAEDGKPCRYVPGRTYALQPGRGKKSVGRILVLQVWEELLADMCDEAAIPEGFGSREAFVTYWTALHGGFYAWSRVWAIRFIYEDEGDQA